MNLRSAKALPPSSGKTQSLKIVSISLFYFSLSNCLTHQQDSAGHNILIGSCKRLSSLQLEPDDTHKHSLSFSCLSPSLFLFTQLFSLYSAHSLSLAYPNLYCPSLFSFLSLILSLSADNSEVLHLPHNKICIVIRKIVVHPGTAVACGKQSRKKAPEEDSMLDTTRQVDARQSAILNSIFYHNAVPHP